jgi:diaminohydroxyphosphoribosylaminopyrimidine deaminase/5-amino-6-(5-phosphoribosylamino)uracil reductase
LDAGLVDKLQAFIAPVIIGGEGAASPVAGRGVLRMADAWRLERTRLEAIGPDWLITGYPARKG